jgi:hypothetical protein
MYFLRKDSGKYFSQFHFCAPDNFRDCGKYNLGEIIR